VLDQTSIDAEGIRILAKDERFRWMSNPHLTVREYTRRMESGDFGNAKAMESIGLSISGCGKYRLVSIDEFEKTDKDRQRGWQRFQVALDWRMEDRVQPDGLFMTLSVNRGAIRIHQMGIRDPNAKPSRRRSRRQKHRNQYPSSSHPSINHALSSEHAPRVIIQWRLCN
jgi:hypothetical protein